jgi:hypothetical protein
MVDGTAVVVNIGTPLKLFDTDTRAFMQHRKNMVRSICNIAATAKNFHSVTGGDQDRFVDRSGTVKAR